MEVSTSQRPIGDNAAQVGSFDVEGAMMSYRSWGLDNTGKPGMLLVHGMLAHARWWDHIAPRFADRFRVVAPDLTGMGDSARRPQYSRRQYSRELVAIARHLGLTDVVVVGHSFSAISALYATLTDPDVFDRAIVVDARIFIPNPTDVLPSQQERSYDSLEEALSRYRLMPPSAGNNPEILDYVARHSVVKSDDGRWRWKFDPATIIGIERDGMIQEMSYKRLPVDLLRGGDSTFMTESNVANFLAHMPACGAPVEVPGAGHHIMLDQPAAFIAAINGLLARPHPESKRRYAEGIQLG